MAELELKEKVIVKHKKGLHLRCASSLMKIASSFQSKITLTKGRKSVNIISALDIITLSASPGAELTITAKGDDAQEALKAVADFFNNPDE